MGIYLGQSPFHARLVALVLSVTTGRVSPQFHVQFDDFFETTRHSQQDIGSLSNWRHQTGLMEVTPVETANNESVLDKVPFTGAPTHDRAPIDQLHGQIEGTGSHSHDSDVPEPPAINEGMPHEQYHREGVHPANDAHHTMP